VVPLDEFLPSQESDDDEETIALAEAEAKDVRREVDLLKKESEMSIDAVLDDLPKEYVDALLKGMSNFGKENQLLLSYRNKFLLKRSINFLLLPE